LKRIGVRKGSGWVEVKREEDGVEVRVGLEVSWSSLGLESWVEWWSDGCGGLFG